MIDMNPPTINHYMKETFPDHIKFVIDGPGTRRLFREKIGQLEKFPIASIAFKEHCYIRIDLNDKTWTPTMAFEWLYRNTPPLIDNELAIELLTKP